MKIGRREKLLLHLMSHFWLPQHSQQGFHLRTGLYKLCTSSSSTGATAAMNTGFLKQLKKATVLLGIHDSIRGNLLLMKNKLPEISI